MYKTFIRPILEYACSAFHTTLTAEQSGLLERIQRSVLKTIYGFKTSYRTGLDLAGLERLDERREKYFSNFTRKAYESQRFNEAWFTAARTPTYALRRPKTVEQHFANRDRLINSPLFRMRRSINDG